MFAWEDAMAQRPFAGGKEAPKETERLLPKRHLQREVTVID